MPRNNSKNLKVTGSNSSVCLGIHPLFFLDSDYHSFRSTEGKWVQTLERGKRGARALSRIR